MKISVKPLDTLFFRDGKPFSMGEDVVAQSIFPPPPSVFYGAIRSAYFGQFPHKFNQDVLNTPDDPTCELHIKGIYLYDYSIIFPIPLDVVIDSEDKEYRAYLLQRTPLNFYSNYPFQQILAPTDSTAMYCSAEGKYIRRKELEKYLSGNLESDEKGKYINYISHQIVETETKVGIAIDPRTKKAEESKLYRIGMKRLDEDVKFIVHFEGLDDMKESGILRLGGEGKTAVYEQEELSTKIKAPDLSNEEGIFKLYFATPAYFTNGWLPGWINPETMKGEYKGVEVELITAAVGKYLSLGGFDMKKRYPKPMRRFVGAGSVYYFKTDPENTDNVIELFHNQCISDRPNDEELSYTQQGYGLCYVGKVEVEQ
ncbi:type III-B CRISPR module-associated protein Cmr3 [Parageobacillus thermoglucosidasius]|uniref:type III-B CRISPR module-associated protein Cmr3 n=1 Tax=Parageobacillus thermoglucosidasius TaxID=1426 RepID=UPI000B5848C7|nr:type III-B CRISPR module-associated protein Cmr3 [Parageobacillus thermoglucosidasius]MBY6269757.1 type III-B CRISPR module-associated protein Cmr3 [Parageobacillus thermoglucosidasius]MED4905582.1 type III-B CRISPR module-associated protein Cmr3 [Parageobacillus thermoglucosidasius]MED4913968.1 type III-B CRISPR module-associated protein Cmr3 [Parageobacillus thermoglucosidasius]MED4945797.1 type III-B CRISPR module-associated protein Cmr3 [Parageobacillus thermoglucosidasius]MED4981274.1 